MIDVRSRSGRAWSERKALARDELDKWTEDDWRIWFVDGLGIWFSRFSTAERARAFAPHRININMQEDPSESIAAFLRRYYPRPSELPALSAESCLDARGRIEMIAVECLRSPAAVQTAGHALLLLNVFRTLNARALPSMTWSLIPRLSRDFGHDPDLSKLVSAICMVVGDTSALTQASGMETDLRGDLEHVLKRSPAFRPSLFYALESSDTVAECLEAFYRLGAFALEGDIGPNTHYGRNVGIWLTVAEEFDRRFGRTAMVRALQRIQELAGYGIDAPGVFAIESLKQFYPEADVAGFDRVDGGQPVSNPRGYDRREIPHGQAEALMAV